MLSESASSPKAGQPIFAAGLLAAVTGAAVSYAIYLGAAAWFHGLTSTTGQMGNAFLMSVVVAMIFWFMAIWSAALPCYIAYRVAGRFGIRSIFYFLLCGALTALLLDPLFVAVLPHMYFEETIRSFTEEYLFQAPALVVSGIGGGLAYWLLLRRHLAYRARD